MSDVSAHSKRAAQTFGKRLRLARLDLGLTQHDLANICKLQPSQVSHLESGHRLPTYRTLVQIWRGLGGTGDYLLGG